MFLTRVIPIGTLTVILRIIVQVLAHTGLFILGRLVVASTPQTASLETHDVVNRYIGQSTATKVTAKWIFSRVARTPAVASSSRPLLLVLCLSLSYNVFVSLSDIAFSGLYPCTVESTAVDTPASIRTADEARTFIASQLINGTDIGSVPVIRCDAPHRVDVAMSSHSVSSYFECTSWKNSTLGDSAIFAGLNKSDSDALISRKITSIRTVGIVPTYFRHTTPGSVRVPLPAVTNGLAIFPYSEGVRVIAGIPQLQKQQTASVSRSLMVDASVGCMRIGIDGANATIVMSNNGSWRSYHGPSYLEETLSRFVDLYRQNYAHLFHNGVSSYTAYGTLFGPGCTYIDSRDIGTIFRSTSEDLYLNTLKANCTLSFQNELGIAYGNGDLFSACEIVRLSAEGFWTEGDTQTRDTQMLCARTTQLSIVSASISVDLDGLVTVDTKQIPSDLHVLDIYPTLDMSTAFLKRFTLSENANGKTSHFIQQNSISSTGLGYYENGGLIITSVGAAMLQTEALGNLCAQDIQYDNFNLSRATEQTVAWAGQLGASYIASSLAYNGWAALADTEDPIYVTTYGNPATCYHPVYSLAFLPLAVTSLIIFLWGLVMLLSSSFSRISMKRWHYGGLQPLADVLGLNPEEKDNTILELKEHPSMRLEILGNECGNIDGANGTSESSSLIQCSQCSCNSRNDK